MRANLDDASIANFDIHDGVLIANVELYWENHTEFLRSCEALVKSEHRHITLDLTHVSFVFSAYMGTIGRLLAETAKSDKKLTIRIGRNLSWLFEMVGFEKMVNIEVVS
ncbi:MAG: STAS domain-containing protein [Planctomycetes bacterium]|nr:STAS domain-containing protein [Planctomycetota bacterium]